MAFVGLATGTAEVDVFAQYGARLGRELSPTMMADDRPEERGVRQQ